MASVPVMDLKPGVKLVKSVYTSTGSLLFHKEKVLLPRDLEILEAFLIEDVEVGDFGEKTAELRESSSIAVDTLAQDQSTLIKQSSFIEEYDKMFNLIKTAFPAAAAAGIPIYEIRNQLEKLIQYIQDYSLISFSPRLLNDYDYMYHNAVLCALSSYKLAEWSGLPKRDLMQVAFAGLFHDIGNVKVDPSILFKPAQLTVEEITEMRDHTMIGYVLLKNVAGINDGVRFAALQHHEKVDGTGYPLGAKNNSIHSYSKIVGIVDIFHAMTLNKAYRKGQSAYLVLEQLLSESFGKLDPKLVQIFIRKLTEFNNGVVVRLSNDMIGEIVFSNQNEPTRPMVLVGKDIINLEQQRSIYIVELIKNN